MRTGEVDYQIVRIVLISVSILAFVFLVASSYKIIEINSPEVLYNCMKTAVLVKNGSSRILTNGAGASLVRDFTGEDVKYSSNTFEVCDIRETGYIYVSKGKKTYIVCENGEIYKYEYLCNTGEKTGNLVSSIQRKWL